MKNTHKIGISGIVAAVLIATVVVLGNVQSVEAEIFSLQGVNSKVIVNVINEGPDTVVLLYDKKGWSLHWDVELKEYRSGGFSLKNPQSGLAIFAHPLEKNNQFKLLIFSSEGTQRYIVQLENYVVVEEEEIEPINNKRIEPKSSIGADITKWDIPTNTTRPADSRK